ncbi:MAG: AtpZ/AtpI family protein [Anaerolineae bacterium]|nr:AtpZ/AtpI family protein [Anaerolineae bacterium]
MKLDRATVRALAVASQLGFTIATAVGLGVLGGLWLDDHLGTSPVFVLTGIVLGLLSAAYVIRDLMTFRRSPGEEEDHNRPGA